MTTSLPDNLHLRLPAYADLFLPDDGDPFHAYVNDKLTSLCASARGDGLEPIRSRSILQKLRELTPAERMENYRLAWLAVQVAADLEPNFDS